MWLFTKVVIYVYHRILCSHERCIFKDAHSWINVLWIKSICIFSRFSVFDLYYIQLCHFVKTRVCPTTGDSITQYLPQKAAYNYYSRQGILIVLEIQLTVTLEENNNVKLVIAIFSVQGLSTRCLFYNFRFACSYY